MPPVHYVAREKPAMIGITAKPAQSVLRRAALLGFAHVPNAFVDKIFRTEVMLPGHCKDRPKLFLHRLIRLIKVIVPDIRRSQVDAALAHRTGKLQEAPITKVTTDFADEAFDASDKKEVRKMVEAASKASEKQVAMRAALKSGSRFLSSVVGVAAKVPAVAPKAKATLTSGKPKRFCLSTIDLDRDAIKRLCPKVPGATFSIDSIRGNYVFYYPGACPASRTRTWGSRSSKAQCLYACLKWQWDEHCKAHKDASCPFEFLL